MSEEDEDVSIVEPAERPADIGSGTAADEGVKSLCISGVAKPGPTRALTHLAMASKLTRIT